MRLVHAADFEKVKNTYIDVIENTPQIERHAQWVYGKHPTDELLMEYIERNEVYFLTDGENIAGVVVICMCQGEDYKPINWQEDLRNDQVAVIHLLAVCPAYQRRSLGLRILDEAMNHAVKNGKKALRLDLLKSNHPAQRLYEKAGFSYRGERKMYAENTGILDFLFYEKCAG